jgi:hypothetical protein
VGEKRNSGRSTTVTRGKGRVKYLQRLPRKLTDFCRRVCGGLFFPKGRPPHLPQKTLYSWQTATLRFPQKTLYSWQTATLRCASLQPTLVTDFEVEDYLAFSEELEVKQHHSKLMAAIPWLRGPQAAFGFLHRMQPSGQFPLACSSH